jgi:cytochrome c-type biogenesis protein CcmH/NrfG
MPVDLNFDGGPGIDLNMNMEGSQARRFDDLDLSQPTPGIKVDSDTGNESGIKIGTPKSDAPRAHTPSVQPLPAFKQTKGQPQALELEEPRDVPMSQSQRLGPKQAPAKPIDPDAARKRAKRVRLMTLIGLFAVALGSFGFYMYRRMAAKRAVESTISDELAKARTALGKSDRGHWDRAAAAARAVLEVDSKNSDALAIAAEGGFAAALANGDAYTAKIGAARKYLVQAVNENLAGPGLIRAQALNAITNSGGDRAVELLKPMVKPETKDATLFLYLGWAYAMHADPATAIKHFDQSAALGTEYVKVCALYSRANAKLDQADLDGANADFKAVLELDKDHIGAQVGLAAAMPASKSQEQEKDLLALFERKDFATGDPRAVVKAWNLAAEAAKRGNRLDIARERYRNAQKILPEDLGTLAGAADVELRDGKLDAASDLIAKALIISKDDIRSQLVQSEISIAKRDLSDAAARIDALAKRNPPPPRLDQARIKMAAGNLASAQSNDEAAAEAYSQAAELAGDTDLAPTLAAVGKLSMLADKATSENDPDKATALREKATKLLEKLEAGAEKDPAIALALGMAYLRTNDATKAEPWLRKFVEARPDDAEGQFQLAKALARLDRTDDAITRLNRAMELAPKRAEIPIELALTYERAKQDDKANEVYTKLLADFKDDASIELRARAGRFFSRRGEKEKAGEQGDAINKVAPNHVAGQFLRAEGLLFKNQIDEARLLYGKAAAAERDPLYFDGLGRANEAKLLASKEVKYQQLAIDAYRTATSLDENMLNPWAGLGRVYMSRKDYALAIPALEKAHRIDQKNAMVAFLMGMAHYSQKDIDPKNGAAAALWFVLTNQLEPNAEAYFHLGELYAEPGNRGKEAAGALDEAARLAEAEDRNTGKMPSWYGDAQYLRGSVHNSLGNRGPAREAWKRYLGQNPPVGPKRNGVERALATELQNP